MNRLINIIKLIFLSMLLTACSVKYIEPSRNGNSVIRFMNTNAYVTIYEDAAECTGPYNDLPWPELVVKSNKELAFYISTTIGHTTSNQRLSCRSKVSFIPKPYTYYTIDHNVPRGTRTCLLEIMEKVSKNGGYSYVPSKVKVYRREGRAVFMNPNGPWCYPRSK